jgi:hypothetical protein
MHAPFESVRRAIAMCVALAGLFDCAAQEPAAKPAAPTSHEAPNSASPTPQWEAVETQKDCAKAEAQCGGGVCDAKVKNDCDAPIRCSLEIMATCSTSGGDSTANGSDHATINAHSSGDVGAQATCGGGDVVHTAIQKLSCR